MKASRTRLLRQRAGFLLQGGYPLPHAVMMLIPEAWAGNPLMDEEPQGLLRIPRCADGAVGRPAAVAFTDGRQIGATLDRNGLRPARYIVTDDDFVIMASEAGVLPVRGKEHRRKWRLQPGKMLLIDLEEAASFPTRTSSASWPPSIPIASGWTAPSSSWRTSRCEPQRARQDVSLLDRQQAFGYTQEDTKFLMAPMAQTGQEAIGSMGTDTPISALSTSRSCSTPISSRTSPRSPTRRSTRSAKSW
jgi:glutamate synthase (NADPH/NADH) large chain